jgi:branched-chain amino acid transport system permease protein
MSDVVVTTPAPPTAPARRTPWFRPYLPVVVVMALVALLPHIGLSNRHVHLGVVCLIWTMAAYGLFVPYAFAGQMTVAIVTAWGVGAFSTGLAIKYWDWGFVPCLGFAMLAAFVAGGLMAMPILRTKGHYFVIITFVIAEAVTVAANNWEVTSGPGGGGISVPKTIDLFGFSFAGRTSMFYLCLVVVALMALSVVWLRGSRLGKHFVSIRENEELARSIGIPTTWLKILALALGGLFAGAAGTFYAYYLSHIDIHEFGVNQAITLILIVVIGGRQATLGPLVGAAVAYYLPELIKLDPNRVLIVYGLVLGLMVIFLPTGVLGGVDSAWKSWQKRRRTRQPASDQLVAAGVR